MIVQKSFENNILDSERLNRNLSFYATFIAVYENMRMYVDEHIKSLYIEESQCRNGKVEYKYSTGYYDKIKNCIVDDKGNKCVTKASFLWLVERGAITNDEYDLFIEIKEKRNCFAHQLLNLLFEDVKMNDKALFARMVELYKSIDKWWIETFDEINDENPHSIIVDLIDIIAEQIIEKK